MVRIWGKLMKSNKFREEKVVEFDNKSLNMNDNIEAALATICREPMV